jgi:hypothetical protein
LRIDLMELPMIGKGFHLSSISQSSCRDAPQVERVVLNALTDAAWSPDSDLGIPHALLRLGQLPSSSELQRMRSNGRAFQSIHLARHHQTRAGRKRFAI